MHIYLVVALVCSADNFLYRHVLVKNLARFSLVYMYLDTCMIITVISQIVQYSLFWGNRLYRYLNVPL